jgi:hypothetical protein
LKKRTLVAVLSLLIVALGVSASPAAGQLSGDSVTGSGTAGPFSFAFDVHSGPSGENPTGTAETSLTSNPSIFARGPVTCLAVQGNHAVIGIANDSGSVGVGTLIEVTDDPDTLVFSIRPAPPTDCSTGVDSEVAPVSSGDIAITDTAALPTTKEQCKKGGWRSFGVFKNQGDCVSFVATGGKNPPAGTELP